MPEPEAKAKAGRLLDLIRDVAGLFIERGAGEYAFFHLSFQEYLCARYITRRRRDIEPHLKRRSDTSDRQPHLFDPRWREVIYLASAYQGQRSDEDASELIELVARQTDLMPHDAEMQYAFRMAFACLRETRVLFQMADEMMRRWVRLCSGLIYNDGSSSSCADPAFPCATGPRPWPPCSKPSAITTPTRSCCHRGAERIERSQGARLFEGSPRPRTPAPSPPR